MVALPIGRYELRAEKSGFAEQIRSGIVLVVGQDATANLRLQVGKVTEQVKVTDNVPVVNASTQDISGLVGEKEVKALPLNGRSYDLLLTLNPGIVNSPRRRPAESECRTPAPAIISLSPAIGRSKICSC